jgi:amino acid adenylation domain-containing protein
VLSAAANLLSRDQALCVADAFVHVVSQVPTASRLSSINWHAPRNLQQLEHWNTEEPEEVQECIHDMILSHARKSPGTPAICSWDGDLTYGQLDELSSKIANRLVVAETIPDTFVGLYFEKSKWTTVAMLAILRAGGAYVFLDPSFPKDRLRKICRQSQVHIVLSSGHLQEQAAALDLPVVPIDENSLHTMPTGMPPSVSVQPHHAAYVSFTSGSSGDPKGAVINHSSFVSGQRVFLDFVQLGPGSRVLQFASYAFDASIWEHLASLMVGGCICVPSEVARQSNLANAINEMKANFLIITPTVARLLRPAEVPCVQTVLLMGEPPSSSDVTTWVDHCRLINGYGPCECSCFSTVRDLVPEDHTQPTLIGRGVGARCWVTDPADIDRLLPVGAIGELVIEGPIVGRGYIGDAEIHNASFIHAPSWRKQVIPSSHHTKMYRTGDLVQYVSGGELRCLGRKDAQAKLRGQRLEMGEVEKHLHEAFDDDIQAALVDIVVPEKGQPVLVGFIQLVNRQTMYEKNIFGEPRSFFQLKAQAALSKMRDRLPSYMVPSTIVELATLPMTKTGKTDRRSLKMECGKLTRSQLDAFTRQAVEKRLPDSHMEHVLAKLISRVLHLEDDFGMNDNFFHLGGDSALVMELIRLAREEGDVEISAQNVFQYPVLSDLALTMKLVPEKMQRERDIPAFSLLNHHISEEDALESASTICGLSSKDEIEDIYPCTPTQEAMMAGTMASATEATYVIRTVYRLPRHINTAQLENAWALVQSSNAILRTRIIHHGDQALQVVLRGGFTWDWSDKLSEAVTVDSQQRMGPGKPLFRVRMIRETDTRRYMMLTIHHALCDGWSLHKTLAQVEAAYYHETTDGQDAAQHASPCRG